MVQMVVVLPHSRSLPVILLILTPMALPKLTMPLLAGIRLQASYIVTPATGDATVTLYAQWEAIPTTMQDITLAQCQQFATDAPLTLTDTRDGSDYTVRYINGNCWMTQNLRLSGGRTLTSADSNVASSWSFPSTSLTSGNSYTDAYSTIRSNTSYGGYYNFCAASAGTVCTGTATIDATYDICPKGWRLPTRNEFTGNTKRIHWYC